MFRPISLFLLVMLLAKKDQIAGLSESSGLFLFLLLGAIPCLAVIVSRYSRVTNINLKIATAIVLLAWAISLVLIPWGNYVRYSSNYLVIVGDVIILFPAVFWLCVLWYMDSPIPNRFAWVIYRLRLDILLLFLPLFVFFVLVELASIFVASSAKDIIEIIAFLIVLGNMPFFITKILSAKPMQNRELLNEMNEVSYRAKVKHPRILVWNTHNRIINALAIGLIFQPTSIVLTDKLIVSLTKKEVLAVTAHEFGHRKYWHTPFLIITVVCAFVWLQKLFVYCGFDTGSPFIFALQLFIMISAIILVSRQLEQQADAYSVIDYSVAHGEKVVTENSIRALSSALGIIASEQQIDVNKNDLLHKSIASRQRNLHHLIGYKLVDIPINKQVKRLKIVLVILLIAGLAL